MNENVEPVIYVDERARVQPGSMDCEAGTLSSMFDRSGLRLITGEVDKIIKIWGEEELGEEQFNI
jgi:pleiotropic regulator 1